MREDLKKPLLEVVRILGITLAVYLSMSYLLPLVLPFFIAILFAKQLHPLVEKLHKKIKLKEGIISGVILLLFLVALVGILWFLGKNMVYQLQQLFGNLPLYREKAMGLVNSCCNQVEHWTGMQADTLQRHITQTMPGMWQGIREKMLPSLMTSSVSWVKGAVMLFGSLVVIGISTLLMLKDYTHIRQKLQQGVLGKTVLGIVRRVYRAGGGYVKAQLIIMLVVSIICIIGLLFTKNAYSLLAGVGIGVCDALPFLGTGTVLIPWAVIEIFQGEYVLAAVYAVLYTICSLTRELLEPKLVGDKLGMPPLAVIISVYVGLCIYGLWGFALGPLSYILIKEIWMELKGT